MVDVRGRTAFGNCSMLESTPPPHEQRQTVGQITRHSQRSTHASMTPVGAVEAGAVQEADFMLRMAQEQIQSKQCGTPAAAADRQWKDAGPMGLQHSTLRAVLHGGGGG